MPKTLVNDSKKPAETMLTELISKITMPAKLKLLKLSFRSPIKCPSKKVNAIILALTTDGEKLHIKA